MKKNKAEGIRAKFKEICRKNIMEYGLLYVCHCGNSYSILTSHPWKQGGKDPKNIHGILSRISLWENLYLHCRIYVCHLRPSVFLPITHLNTYFAFLLSQKVIFFSCNKNIGTDFITIEKNSIVTLEVIL